MQLAVARRVTSRSSGDLLAVVLCGLSAGVAAGFLLSEVFGSGGHRRIGRLLGYRQPADATRAGRGALLIRARQAMAAEPRLSGETIEVRSRGPGELEVRGWVANRAAHGLAYRIAREASGGREITNRLLVRGEDDRAGAPGVEDAPRSA